MNTNNNSKMQLTNAQQVGSEIGTNPTQLTLPELFRKVEGSVSKYPPPQTEIMQMVNPVWVLDLYMIGMDIL